ncbi:YqzE-like protein [Gracilibacillus ureilyticus]|uniref:YqzE-like protein n=1 Tax=Gracilibacillus ureilyticus TaxID=531814 RepID=A0A1H9LYK0_9BACI|nr:YqzE family protein [Gracilibacillus ureilyticus]SER16500.1 YqzE-like protein [Gracilibacillus ureilyticus]
MANDDYVKYVTQRIVKYMDTPKHERRRDRSDREKDVQFYSNRWFGVLPFAVRLFWQKRKG